jgi:hypothetical protein
VVPAGVKRALGATILGVSFQLGRSDAPADAIAWVVDIDRAGGAGSFKASFDPVEGRLLSVIRR